MIESCSFFGESDATKKERRNAQPRMRASLLFQTCGLLFHCIFAKCS